MENTPTEAPREDRLAVVLGRKHLPGLDAIRAVAAFLVVYYHAGAPFVSGGMGVLAFFVLSGFLITWLLLAEQEKYGGISFRLFYIRRSLRIFPAFYCYFLLLTGLLWITAKRIVWPQAAASFFYVNNYWQAWNGDPNTGLSHTWSLGIEEQFYLLWPVGLVWLERRGWTWRALTLLVPALWLLRLTLKFGFDVPQSYIYSALETRADHLLTGALLAVALRRCYWRPLWARLIAHPALPLLTLAALAGSMAAGNVYGHLYRDSAGFILDPLLVAVWIVQWMALGGTGLWSLVEHPAVRYLGQISYSIYLYQQIVPDSVRKLWPAATGLPRIAAVTVLVLALASLSYWVIERPFLRWKDRFSR